MTPATSSLWYQRHSSKCRHETPTRDGKRMVRCERFARLGTDRCPAHGKGLRPFDAQQTCIALVSFFWLVTL